MKDLRRDLVMGLIFTAIGIIYLVAADEVIRFLIFMVVTMYASSAGANKLMGDKDEQSEFLQDYKRTARGRTASR